MERITSANNTRIKRVAALMKKPRERREQKLFVAEGERLVRETPGGLLRELYVSESYFGEPAHAGWLKRQEAAGVGLSVLSDALFARVSDTQTPQGILAVAAMPEYGLSRLLRGEATLLLLLEGVQDPGNLGTMLRTGEGAGITGVIADAQTADLFQPKTIRSTMGSIFRVPFYRTERLTDVTGELKAAGVRIFAAHLGGTSAYDACDYRGASAFLIGNEGNGLTDETAAAADEQIRIPMEGEVESLNAAVSAALLLYEANRQRRRK